MSKLKNSVAGLHSLLPLPSPPIYSLLARFAPLSFCEKNHGAIHQEHTQVFLNCSLQRGLMRPKHHKAIEQSRFLYSAFAIVTDDM